MKKRFNVTICLFIIYCVLLVWIILFKLSLSIGDFQSLDRFRSINLIPFYYGNYASFQLVETIENLLIFIPFGLYLKMLGTDNVKPVLYAFFCSLVFEIYQYAFSIGASDITDVITNTLGAIVGVLIYNFLLRTFRDKKKINKGLGITALIVTVLFILLLLVLLFANRN